MIRAITKRDIPQIKEIHNKHFSNEFSIEDLQQFICNFVVTDDETDKVITAGVVRSIAEIIIVTDKDIDIHQRRLALLQMLTAGCQTTRMAGYNQLHAFIQDDKWLRHLIKYGFRPTVGKSVIIEV